jgi:hypothetical protein
VGRRDLSDAIGKADDPKGVVPDASTRLADVVPPADVGKTFGVPNDRIPWPDTYWPFLREGIDAQWGEDASPLEKYMLLDNPGHVLEAKDWEHWNHGTGVAGVKDWYGHCQGWVAASLLNLPALHTVHARRQGDRVESCAEGDPGCVAFFIGDLTGLAAEVYLDAPIKATGARCDRPLPTIAPDVYGRVPRDGTGCKGLNAGALVAILAARVKRDKKPLAIEVQTASSTDQIWNQPAFAYTVNRLEPLDPDDAGARVASVAGFAQARGYPWDDAARAFALIDLSISWVHEHGPNRRYVSGAQAVRKTRIIAVLELDAPASDPEARILGGEYVDDPSVGADRLTVPPYVWIPTGEGPENVPVNVSGRSHNPWVRPSIVRSLLALSRAPVAAGAPPEGDPEPAAPP